MSQLENTTVCLEKGCLTVQARPLCWAEVGAACHRRWLICLWGHSHACSATAGIAPIPDSAMQSQGTAQVQPSFCCRHPCCCGVYSIPRILFKIISLLSQWEALECMIQSFDFLFCGRPMPSTCLWSQGGYMHSTTEIRQPESLNYSGVSYPGKSLHSFWGQADKNPYFPDLKYQCEFVASSFCINTLSILWDS